MDFDFSEDQREIQSTARGLLEKRAIPERVRAAAEGDGFDHELWQEMRELGWPGIAIGEEHEGAGLGLVELCVLLEEQGAALAPTPLLPSACAALVIQRAGSDEQRRRWLPELATGAATGALGASASAGDPAFVAGGTGADVVVVLRGDRGFLLPGGGGEGLEAIDPLRKYAMVAATGEELPGEVVRGFAEASIGIAAELTGICQRTLDLSIAYVKERRQFGVPIGSFQAVAHRCAEMLLATESARSATYYAAWTADSAPEQLAEASAMAKMVASRAAIEVSASAIQAHGGIGFTWEADLHWFYKRAQMSAQLMGGAAHHAARLGSVLGARAAPSA